MSLFPPALVAAARPNPTADVAEKVLRRAEIAKVRSCLAHLQSVLKAANT